MGDGIYEESSETLPPTLFICDTSTQNYFLALVKKREVGVQMVCDLSDPSGVFTSSPETSKVYREVYDSKAHHPVP